MAYHVERSAAVATPSTSTQAPSSHPQTDPSAPATAQPPTTAKKNKPQLRGLARELEELRIHQEEERKRLELIREEERLARAEEEARIR